MKKSIREKISEATDYPIEMALDLPQIRLLGDLKLEVENYKRLIEYTEENIRLGVKNQDIIVRGKDMYIEKLEAENIKIAGEIISVEFTKKIK